LDELISKLAGAFGQQLEAGFQRLERGKARKDNPSAAPTPPPSAPKKEAPYYEPAAPVPTTKRGYWYAVINGRDGVNAVFADWVGGASEYVTGVPGATVKKYSDYQDAMDRVEQHVHAEKAFSHQAPVAAPPVAHGIAGIPAPKARPKSRMSRPPLMLYGSDDPSSKNEDEVFGIDLGSEIELREGLCPPGLPAEMARTMCNSLIDVVALPGGFLQGVDSNEGGDLAMMSQALEELVHQGRSVVEGSSKSDLQWRSDKRTHLRTVKSGSVLVKRIKALLKLRGRVLKNTVKMVSNLLRRAGWNDPDLIDSWATSGFVSRIVRDSMDAWISLHQHLLGLSTTEGVPWSYIKVEIDHHVEELELIRNTQDSRLQALCSIYCYLRDSCSGNWYSTSLQYKRNTSLYCQATGLCSPGGALGFPGGGDAPQSANACTHCGTTLHQGGKSSCPWRSRSKKQAKKASNQALRMLGDGACPNLNSNADSSDSE
jgi:hypothetical protein